MPYEGLVETPFHSKKAVENQKKSRAPSSCFAPLGPREPDFFRLRLRVRELVRRLFRAASTRRQDRAEQMGSGSSKAVWQAAYNGDEAKLRQLINRGANVNWHSPEALFPHSPASCTARLGAG